MTTVQDIGICLTIVGIIIGALVAIALAFMNRAATNQLALMEEIRCSCENHITAVDNKVNNLSDKFEAMDKKVDDISEAVVRLDTNFENFIKNIGQSGSYRFKQRP